VILSLGKKSQTSNSGGSLPRATFCQVRKTNCQCEKSAHTPIQSVLGLIIPLKLSNLLYSSHIYPSTDRSQLTL